MSDVKEWPKTMYRPAPQGGLEHHSFACEQDVPAQQGWTDYNSAKAEAKPEPVTVSKVQKADAAKDRAIEDQRKQIEKLVANLGTMQIAANQAQSRATDAEVRLADVCDVVRTVLKEADLPEDLRQQLADAIDPPKKTPESVAAEREKRREPRAKTSGKAG